MGIWPLPWTGGGALSGPREAGHTHARVQSPEWPPDGLALRPPRARRGRPRAAGGAGRGGAREAPQAPAGSGRRAYCGLASAAEESCFSGLFRALPAQPFPVRADPKQTPSRGPGRGGCDPEGPGSAVPRRKQSGRPAPRSRLLPGLARLPLPRGGSCISSARNWEAPPACQAPYEVPSR